MGVWESQEHLAATPDKARARDWAGLNPLKLNCNEQEMRALLLARRVANRLYARRSARLRRFLPERRLLPTWERQMVNRHYITRCAVSCRRIDLLI